MCGIWGIFPTDNKGFFQTDTQTFEQAMILTSLRGSHSTGLAMVADGKARPKVVKTVGGPAFLINTDAWDKICEFSVKKAKLIFGHGRYATKGEINVKNAHPFVHEHITLVHNGTINYGLKDQHDELATEVDSHALCAAIAKKGLVPALEDIFGAYALIVHDAKEGCVYVVRNDERPLHRVVFFDKHIILSEYDACKYLAAKMGHTSPKIEVFPKHVIFKYDIASSTWTTDTTLKEIHEKKYTTPANQLPWAGSTHSANGGNTKWGQGGKISGISESTYYCSIDLLLTRIEPIPNTKQYKYVFYDDNGFEYHALSAHNYDNRISELAKCTKHTKMTDRISGEVTRFVKFRELDWVKDPIVKLEQVETKEKQEEDKGPVMTYNKYLLTRDQWNSYVAKEDCAVCSGPIYENEAENTILTPSKTLICGDCIVAGRHYSFGYGQ